MTAQTDDYLEGHEDGFNEGYEAGALDKPKDLGSQLGVGGAAVPTMYPVGSGPAQLSHLISNQMLTAIGGPGARVEIQGVPGPGYGDVQIVVRADSSAQLAHVLAMLGSTVASMEGNIRQGLARGTG